MIDRALLISEEVDVMLAERAEMTVGGPTIRIVHSGPHLGYGCLPGERVLESLFVYRARNYRIVISPTEAVVFDFLARHRVPRTASQIAVAMKDDVLYWTFLREQTGRKRKAKVHRTSLKVHIQRIRRALDEVFRKAYAPFSAEAVLPGKRVGNQVEYRLRAHVDLVHINE